MFAANSSVSFSFSFQSKACLAQPKFPLATKILVRNLPYSAGESRLQKEFSSFGPIAEVELIKDEASKKSKGYAFIQYTSQDDAMLALENMDHKYFDGRLIYVELAKPGKEMRSQIIASGPPSKEITPSGEGSNDEPE